MEIRRIVLAADDVAAMVAFYDAVFGTALEQVSDAGFHLGTWCGIELLICPNSIAEVDARQNRHQFRIAVGDLDATRAAVAAHGGTVLGGHDVVGIADPEGNTYELVSV